MVSPKRDCTRGKEEEGNGSDVGAVQQSSGEPPGGTGCALLWGVSSITRGTHGQAGGGGLLPPNIAAWRQEKRKKNEKQRQPSGKPRKELCWSITEPPWKSFPYSRVARRTPYMIFTPSKNGGCECLAAALTRGWERGNKFTAVALQGQGQRAQGLGKLQPVVGCSAKAELRCNFVFMI